MDLGVFVWLDHTKKYYSLTWLVRFRSTGLPSCTTATFLQWHRASTDLFVYEFVDKIRKYNSRSRSLIHREHHS